MRRAELLATAVFAAAAVPRRARAQAADKIQIAAPISEGQTDLYYAIKTGLFSKARLDVSIVSVTNGAAGTTAVVAGNYDLAITNALSIFSAHLREIPVVMIAPSIVNTVRNPFAELQVAADSAYKTAADLNGKTIGSPSLSDTNVLAIRAWVDKNGGNWRSLKFVEVPNVALEAALVQHRVDAAMLLSPALDASLAAGTTRTLAYAYGAIAPRFMGSAYVARRDWAAQHADVLRRFVRTLAVGTNYVAAHPVETAPLVAEYTKINIEDLGKMHRATNGLYLEAPLIQPLIDAAAKYELISRAFPARELIWP